MGFALKAKIQAATQRLDRSEEVRAAESDGEGKGGSGKREAEENMRKINVCDKERPSAGSTDT